MKRTVLGITFTVALLAVAGTGWAGPGFHGLNLSAPNELDSDFAPITVETTRPTGLSWFSSERLSFSHSLSYGVFSSSTFGTNSMGLWSTRVGYQISRPLSLNAEVGVIMDPSNEEPLSPNSVFLKSMDLQYRPSKNFQMRILYQGAPQGGYPAWSYGRYGLDPFDQRDMFPRPFGQ